MSPLGKCRFCNTQLSVSFADLGMSPLANSYVNAGQIHKMEAFYPLHAYVCDACYLVQLETFETPAKIFSNYAYFSSFSDSWLRHAREYADKVSPRFGLGGDSSVVEIASNDGYLLQYFKQKGIPILGIEPAENVAKVAQQAGIPTIVKFFGAETADELVREGRKADLLIGNNVLAHVPDINDFVGGMKRFLAAKGIITMEFPHLVRLIAENQFDTIYHEHFSYLSFLAVEKIFSRHGLTLFDVDEIPTHGGSLRIYARHSEDNTNPISNNVSRLKHKEDEYGLRDIKTYMAFAEKVKETKRKLLEFLINVKRQRKTIVGYGAPAKGNTLLNYCGIRTDFIDYTVDRSPHKQGCYLPGTRIPIFAPDKIRETKPDYVLILPWNLRDEIVEQMKHIKDWGGQFITPIPEPRVIS